MLHLKLLKIWLVQNLESLHQQELDIGSRKVNNRPTKLIEKKYISNAHVHIVTIIIIIIK